MATTRPRRRSAAPPAAGPDLEAKARPRQERAQDTFERILAVTAELLGELGIERLSTNLVCERAGLTPPALYRYFPNKYALLRELGERLMAVQNELLAAWATPQTMKLPRPAFERSVLVLFAQTLELTQQAPGGVWITRALRAVPALQEVRIGSHRQVTGLIEAAFMSAWPEADRERVRVLARLSVEASYATTEMLFDDPALDAQAVGTTLASMIASQVVVVRRG
ncbi:TetR/AcrR family transcriptional regulator [Aquincola sp. S2]|uniref:TetR/AcrR family transcriptional regulator n=1 Tax=Pseudaquabacterium terrae TaxID=2732868 RepID=A0ABX2E969_9BURK|nr:TetR/AcrR family transcriptional regulator [Aquabacterium terrae]NRF65509.1 TetR/AcrR family transcriptional regulator [Aquabacterium terrae]